VSSGERYVFAAYAVVLATVLVYLVIIALKMSRLERDLAELARLARQRAAEHEQPARQEAAVG
jgi:heme exporter protein D